ncbi:MAG: AraC family ligand binding domain-containing protein, partial [Planctomycetota bacterium]
MVDRWSAFRPSPAPTIAIPFGVRSIGQYRLDAGPIDNIPPRRFVQLYWCTSGRIRFIIPTGTAVIGAGEIFVYPSRTAHRMSALDPSTVYWWLTVDGPMADRAVEAFGLRPPWPRRAGPPPERLFRRIASLIPDPAPANERAAAVLGWEL